MWVSFSFLVIFSHVNQLQSVKWANNNNIFILNSHFRLRKLRMLYQGTKNVAIYAFSSGKILDVRKVAGVKNMTNIMSGPGYLYKYAIAFPTFFCVAALSTCQHSVNLLTLALLCDCPTYNNAFWFAIFFFLYDMCSCGL